ncbi:hypothetical protein AB4254_08080 [Vibrio breoganii]
MITIKACGFEIEATTIDDCESKLGQFAGESVTLLMTNPRTNMIKPYFIDVETNNKNQITIFDSGTGKPTNVRQLVREQRKQAQELSIVR